MKWLVFIALLLFCSCVTDPYFWQGVNNGYNNNYNTTPVYYQQPVRCSELGYSGIYSCQ